MKLLEALGLGRLASGKTEAQLQAEDDAKLVQAARDAIACTGFEKNCQCPTCLRVGGLSSQDEAAKLLEKAHELSVSTGVTFKDAVDSLLNAMQAAATPKALFDPWANDAVEDLPTDREDETQKLLRMARATKERDDLVIQCWRRYSLGQELTEGGMRWKLTGFFSEWESRQFEAECNGSTELAELHLATGECPISTSGHGCGIYGVKEREQLRGETGHVEALCVLWGWVIPGSRGWMAQYGRIEQLYLVDPDGQLFEAQRIADELGEQYGVPVVYEVPSREDLREDDQPVQFRSRLQPSGLLQHSFGPPPRSGPSLYSPSGTPYANCPTCGLVACTCPVPHQGPVPFPTDPYFTSSRRRNP
jgi:hypothetical protein